MRIGRSSSSPQPRVTTAEASSRLTSRPLALSTSNPVALPDNADGATRVTPGMPISAPWTSPPGASTCTYIVSDPRSREVRLSGVSTATTRPLLMMTTRWQVWLTSGRMCVLRMMVWSPASSLMSCRVSMICFGSSPAVGSSRISTSGLCRIACASPTRCL